MANYLIYSENTGIIADTSIPAGFTDVTTIDNLGKVAVNNIGASWIKDWKKIRSGSNAISGIVIIGATIDVLKAAPDDYFSLILGFFAIALASINVFGGFLVTDRILGMFKKKKYIILHLLTYVGND